MKYTSESFNVALGSDEYREGWERIFGKKKEPMIEWVLTVNPETPVTVEIPDRPVLCGCGAPLMKDGFCHDCGKWSGHD